MANITIAQLVAKAIELNPSLTEDAAKELIKNANAKSYKKVAEVVEAAKAKSKRGRKPAGGEVKIVEPGPRGFRFGSAYVQSVIDASGIAMKQSNKLKLVKFAEAVGIAGVTMKTDAAEAVKMMKSAAKKFLAQNFKAA